MGNITIKIEYELDKHPGWHSVEFSPDEYFDLDPDEEVTWDCVPFNSDTREYLDLEKESIKHVILQIVDLRANTTLTSTETFWNQGENRIVERRVSGALSSCEVIVDIKLQSSPPIWEILRFDRERDIPVVSYHGFIRNSDDGSQEERVIYQRPTSQ